jgi:hypothetical protein
VEAYIARAAFAQAITNCLTEGGVTYSFQNVASIDYPAYLSCEVMFDWAREQAKDLDNEFVSTKKLRGPLHGVPVSLLYRSGLWMVLRTLCQTSFKDQCNQLILSVRSARFVDHN